MNKTYIVIEFLNLIQELGYHYEDLYTGVFNFDKINNEYIIFHYGRKQSHTIEDSKKYIFDNIPNIPIEILNIEVNKLRIIDSIEEDKVRKEIRLKRQEEKNKVFNEQYEDFYGTKND